MATKAPLLIKATIQLPVKLHTAAKIEAVRRQTTLRELVIAGLKQELGPASKKGGR